MKNLLSTFILLAITFLGCSNPLSTEKEAFKPYKVGSFLITSEDDAEGLQEVDKSKSLLVDSISSDTVSVLPNNGYALSITDSSSRHESGRSVFYLTFTDSSITEDDIDIHPTAIKGGFDITRKQEHYENVFYSYSKGVGVGDYLKTRAMIQYKCGQSVIDDTDYIYYTAVMKNGDRLTYSIPALGLIDTLEDIVCN